MHIVTTRKEERNKKSFKKVQTPRFWVLTERDDALIMHAQVDDKKAACSPSM
jgi:Co/Zn/Cd efflux system component